VININVGDLFKSLGAFLVKNWQGVGLVVMLVLFFVTKNDYASLKKSMEVMSTSYEQQLAALEELHKKEIAAREAAIIEYERELLNLSEKYDDAVEDLKRGKEEDIKEFIRDFEEQPAELAREIEETFGFDYVE
jgi:pyruvate/2-oxoacid:ferredoxin oxidoreductase beta subunit